MCCKFSFSWLLLRWYVFSQVYGLWSIIIRGGLKYVYKFFDILWKMVPIILLLKCGKTLWITLTNKKRKLCYFSGQVKSHHDFLLASCHVMRTFTQPMKKSVWGKTGLLTIGSKYWHSLLTTSKELRPSSKDESIRKWIFQIQSNFWM